MDEPTLLSVTDLCEAIGRTYSPADMASIATTLRDLSEMFGPRDADGDPTDAAGNKIGDGALPPVLLECQRPRGHRGRCSVYEAPRDA